MIKADINAKKYPSWLKVRFRNNLKFNHIIQILNNLQLNTICDKGMCPNKCECFSKGITTIMILGDICTRNCKYCNVSKGKPSPIDKDEPLRVAKAIQKLNLNYAVITSVTRDDLPDGGASIFVEIVKQIKEIHPKCKIELLIPDFNGDKKAIENVVNSGADVISHNIETVKELFSDIRPQGNYAISLKLLKEIKKIKPTQKVKSGIMFGFGENDQQIEKAFIDLRNAGCDFVTFGQYLQPSKNHTPVFRYYTQKEFQEWKDKAYEMGFLHVESGPLVRSSYMAERALT